jgi:hypothetical protein
MAGKGRGSKSLGFLGLVGAAAAVWYFLDPRKGRDRREKVATKSKEIYEKTSVEAKRITDEAQRGLATAVDRTGEIARQGLEAISSASHNVAEGAQRIKERAVDRVESSRSGASSSPGRLAQEAEKAVAKAKSAVHNAAKEVASKTEGKGSSNS